MLLTRRTNPSKLWPPKGFLDLFLSLFWQETMDVDILLHCVLKAATLLLVPVSSSINTGVQTHIQLWCRIDELLKLRPLIAASHTWKSRVPSVAVWTFCEQLCNLQSTDILYRVTSNLWSEDTLSDILLPMLTFLVSWETCTSIFRLRRLALFLRFPGRVTSKSCPWKLSLMGVTVADGTEEVGVLDLLPVLLGVAATESDSDPSSLVRHKWHYMSIVQWKKAGDVSYFAHWL